MYNDFVVVGPARDPAAGAGDGGRGLQEDRGRAKAPFVSRGTNDSGTDKAEPRVRQHAGVDAKAASGTWYREAGSGMGATLNTGVGMGAYVFTHRATWSSFKTVATSACRDRRRREAVQPVWRDAGEPGQAPQGEGQSEGQAFIDWVLSSEGQAAIGAFQINGEQQFFPNASPAG